MIVDPVHVLAARIFEEWGAQGMINDEPVDPPDPEWEKAKVAAQTALANKPPYWWDGSKIRTPTLAEVQRFCADEEET